MTRRPTALPFLVSPKGDAPLQRQLYEGLRGLILSGRLSPGARLPSSRQMAAEQDVSRNTVLIVYDRLIAEGYLEAKPASHIAVAPDLPDSKFPSPTSRPQRILEDTPLKPERFAGAFTTAGADESNFPFPLWARLLGQSWRKPTPDILHAEAAGLTGLRQAVANYAQSYRGLSCHSDQVLILAGIRQGLALVASLTAGARGAVALEDPGYRHFYQSLSAQGRNSLAIPVDEAGLDPNHLGRHKTRLVCVTPGNHYPLGYEMSLARRLELISWANARDSYIFEDDYEAEFRYRGPPLPALQGLDPHRVFHVGTFAKTTFGAMGLAYLILPESFIMPARAALLAQEGATATHAQIALARFIEDGHFTSHLRRMRKIYAERQGALREGLLRHCGNWLEPLSPAAGLHLTAFVKKGVGEARLLHAGEQIGIKLTGLARHYYGAKRRGGILLGFSRVSPAIAETALRAYAKALASSSARSNP